jgi:hypothetical protein
MTVFAIVPYAHSSGYCIHPAGVTSSKVELPTKNGSDHGSSQVARSLPMPSIAVRDELFNRE